MRAMLALILCLLTGLPAMATTPSADVAKTEQSAATDPIGSFVDSLNIPQVLTSWERMLAVQQRFPSCGDREKDERIQAAWVTAVGRALKTRSISLERTRTAAAAAFSPEELRTLQAFHSSSFGANVLTKEREAMAERSTQDAATAAAGLALAQKTIEENPARKRALARLSRAAGGEDVQLDMLVNVQTSLAVGMLAASKGRPQFDMDEINAAVEQTKPMLRKMISAFHLVGYEQIYRQLSVADLDAYSDHLESPLGKKSVAFALHSYNEVLGAAMMAVGEEFTKEMTAIDL